MATMTVKNAAGGDETVEKPLAPGRAAATASRPVSLSTEDLAALAAIKASVDVLVPPALGRVAAASSSPVALSNEDLALLQAISAGTEYNETAPTYADLEAASLQTSARGDLKVALSKDGIPLETDSSGLTHNQITLTAGAKEVVAANANRFIVRVKNIDAAIVIYIGKDNTVTTTNGYPLGAGAELPFPDGYLGPIWAIPASGTPKCAFIQY